MSAKKTAVIVIHGLGEQRPMDTISSFVKAAWETDQALIHPSRAETWAKPQLVTDSFELRRITTRESNAKKAKRVDFFEYYWAHHMQGHTVGQLKAWLSGLFIRAPSTVPRSVFGVWKFGIVLLIVGMVITGVLIAKNLNIDLPVPNWILVVSGFIATAATYLLHRFILPYAGDAARYLSPTPDNVAIRQKIRQQGVQLIEDITATGKYDRIVLVGHSLGAVIAYDIINFAWNRLDASKMADLHRKGSSGIAALSSVEEKGLAINAAGDDDTGSLHAYREAQRRYHTSLNGDSDAPFWIVSDLVTLGSPLSKADVLLANNAAEFEARQKQRELPSCPPIYESSSDESTKQFSYPVGKPVRRPHHAAPFGAVVWSNIYVPHRFVIFGDVISGPVRKLFGKGVLDIKIPIGRPPGFRHTKYWTLTDTGPSKAVQALRRALNLAELEAESDIWKGYEEGVI